MIKKKKKAFFQDSRILGTQVISFSTLDKISQEKLFKQRSISIGQEKAVRWLSFHIEFCWEKYLLLRVDDVYSISWQGYKK